MNGLHQATHIEVEAEVRYWEDAIVNDVKDDDGSRIFGRDGDLWKIQIDLASGRIEDWPEGVEARIHYKVCDAGEYWLTDAASHRIAKWRGHYVPSRFLCHGGNRHSDYIIMNVSAGGVITSYSPPEISEEDWNSLVQILPGVGAA